MVPKAKRRQTLMSRGNKTQCFPRDQSLSVLLLNSRCLVSCVLCLVSCSLRSKRFRRVWEQRKTEERGFRYFACAENGARAKNRTVGVGEGKEGTACGQTPGF